MELLSINVSLPKTVEHEGRKVSTGIYKEPIPGPVRVGPMNLSGDGQGDLLAHGGVYKAVHVYDMGSYRYWQEELGRGEFPYGQFGENFTTSGMPDDGVHIGDIFRIGSATFEVTQPRTPCFKLEMKMGIPAFSHRFLESGRSGFYLRVLEEGEVEAGDPIERVKEGPERVSVRDVINTRFFDRENREMVRRILNVPALSPEWRRSFEKLL